MGVPADFARKQEEVVRVYRRLGIRLECTCTPYYLALTNYGDHLAWSESSAVCYANSVIGARTNREGGPSALAAALVGKTPFYGLHLVENRRPTVAVRVEGAPDAPGGGGYGALGVCGRRWSEDPFLPDRRHVTVESWERDGNGTVASSMSTGSHRRRGSFRSIRRTSRRSL